MNVRDLFDTVQEQAEAGVGAAAGAAVDGKTALLKALEQAGKMLGSLEADSVLERIGLRVARPSIARSVVTFGAGAVVGAVAGVLLAPQSGEQTRAQLASRLDDLLRRVRASSDDLRHDVEHAVDEARDQAKDVAHDVSAAADQTKDAASRLVDQTRDAASRAVDQTKDAVRDAAQELRAGASHLGKAPNSPV